MEIVFLRIFTKNKSKLQPSPSHSKAHVHHSNLQLPSNLHSTQLSSIPRTDCIFSPSKLIRQLQQNPNYIPHSIVSHKILRGGRIAINNKVSRSTAKKILREKPSPRSENFVFRSLSRPISRGFRVSKFFSKLPFLEVYNKFLFSRTA
jgi:hypothetical protein